jgi:ParB family transcriptional regulator, chromosome partitioning protein
MADQKDTYGAKTKFTGFWIPPENLIIAGVDCDASLVPDVADPDRLKLDVEDLALNIAQHGIRDTVIVRKYPHLERAVVVAGRRRVRAARIANTRLSDDKKVLVPCISEKNDAFASMVLENEHRVNDTPLARARKARRYRERGASTKEICITFGVEPSTLSNWWALLEASPEVQTAVEQGVIGATVGAEIGRVAPPDQAEALRRAIEAGRGGAALENVRAMRKPRAVNETASRRLSVSLVKKFTAALTPDSGDSDVDTEHLILANAVLRAVQGEGPSALSDYPAVAKTLKSVMGDSVTLTTSN